MTFFTDAYGGKFKSGWLIVNERGEIILQKDYPESLNIFLLELFALGTCCKLASSQSTIITDAKAIKTLITNKKSRYQSSVFCTSSKLTMRLMIREARELVKKKNLKIYWLPRKYNLAGRIIEKERRFKFENARI